MVATRRGGWLVLAFSLSLIVGTPSRSFAGDASEGALLFIRTGCYECHGTTAAGSSAGPQLAPNPISLQGLIRQLRQPIGGPAYNIKMPAYSTALISDAQIGDIYAYLASLPPTPRPSEITLLNR